MSWAIVIREVLIWVIYVKNQIEIGYLIIIEHIFTVETPILESILYIKLIF